MEKIKLAVAGLGGIAQVMHLPILLKMQDVEIAAVCDKDTTKAKNVSKKYNIKSYYKDMDSLLKENPEVEGVIIATTTDTHYSVSMKCLNAGKNILIERPIARNLKETEKIVEEAEKCGKILMVGMNNRFRSDVSIQKSFIRSREIDNVYYVKTGWLKTQGPNQKWLTEKDRSGGGVFLDNGIVMLDIGLWMLDFTEISYVSAINYFHHTKSVEDSNFTLIKCRNGASLTIEVSWSLLRSKEFYYCNVYGKTGSTSINPLKVYKSIDNNLLDITPQNVKAVTDLKTSYENQLRHFVDVLKGNEKLISTGDQALTVMKIVDAVYKSAKLGKEVVMK
jgi:predicted dehydrogenase